MGKFKKAYVDWCDKNDKNPDDDLTGKDLDQAMNEMNKKFWEEWNVIDHAYVERYLTTRQVAEITLLSLGTIQKMIDEGEIKSWLTRGGHRRVLASSVKTYLVKRKKEMGV